MYMKYTNLLSKKENFFQKKKPKLVILTGICIENAISLRELESLKKHWKLKKKTSFFWNHLQQAESEIKWQSNWQIYCKNTHIRIGLEQRPPSPLPSNTMEWLVFLTILKHSLHFLYLFIVNVALYAECIFLIYIICHIIIRYIMMIKK